MSESSAPGECPSENTLARLVATSLSLEAAEPTLIHLDECAACRDLVAELARAPAPSLSPVRGAVEGEAAPALLEPGERVGRYVVIQEVGEGGMGVVYAAYDPELDRKVALKVVRPGRSRPKAGHLAREARALARVSHPNVVAVHDVGYHGDQLYLVMEFVNGVTLRRWLGATRQSAAAILGAMRDAGAGLAAAHRAGVVHRDVKPENIMIDEHGRARVTDFGLAQEAPTGDALGPQEVAGTPRYMAPEQLRRERVDARSDQFSFAVTLAEALLGRHPHDGAEDGDLLRRGSSGPPPLAFGGAPGLPRELPAAVARALEPDPGRRFASMDGLLSALVPPRRRSWRLLALVVAGLVACGSVIAWMEHRRSTALAVCKGADQMWSGIWDAGRREELGQAFRALPVPYAEEAWNTVRQTFDRYATEWSRAYTDSCEATRLRKVQSEAVMDQQMACLDARRRELSALVEELAHPTPSAASRAANAVSALSSVASCSDPRTTRSRRRFDDPQADQRAGEVEDRLLAAKAKVSTGALVAARALIDPTVQDARELGDRRTEAQALLVSADLYRRTSEETASETTALEALWAAEANRDDDVSALAWLELLGLGGLRGRSREASTYYRHAEAAIARLGNPPMLRARLCCKQAFVEYEASGDYQRAQAEAQEGLGTLESAGAGRSVEAANCHGALGAIAERRDDFEGARVHFGAALTIVEALKGHTHPQVAQLFYSLGSLDGDVGRLDEALEMLAHAETVYRATGTYQGHAVVELEQARSDVAARQGKTDEAIAHVSESLKRAVDELGDAPTTVLAYGNFADMLVRARRRYDEARQAFQDGLAMMGRLHLINDEFEMLLRAGLGRVDLETGRPSKALESLEPAVKRYDKGDLNPAARALANLSLARALAALHRDPARVAALLEGVRARLAADQEAFRTDLDELDTLVSATR